ncbi:beta strand repeat-containing protein [Deinococcus altitudinis]|uniref:beta strand repeat-containing protein n=1 Tax=Deinococcus altitudinis TaxID=468914 RepID=UPI003891B074
MNVNQKVLALMVALAAGVAGAAGTTAGTVIQNTASATYTDPSTNLPAVPAAGSPAGTPPAVSNTVSTTVNAVPNFTITPNDAGAAGPSQDQPYAPYDKAGVLPGSQQVFQYTVTNTGNTPVTVNLSTLNRSDTTVAGVKYYIDADNSGTITAGDTLLDPAGPFTATNDTNGDGTVDTGSIAPDANVKILQVYTVPTIAAASTYYGADPVGNAKYDPAYKPGNATPTTSSTTVVPDPTSGTGNLTDNDNFNRVLVYTPTVSAGPIDDNSTGGTTPVAGGPTDGQTNPASGTTPGGTQPTYNDPTNPAIKIGVSGGVQKAYPPADTETVNADKVTFINSITNGGSATDSFFLLPPAGLPAGVTVAYLDAAGNALPLVTNTDGVAYPQVQNVAPGQTVNFRVVVTYPDTDGATPPTSPINVIVPLDSASDANVTPDATTTDIIYPPVLQFGDSTTGVGTAPAPAPDQLVSPGTLPTLVSNNNADSTAIFPMDLANVGGYDESYRLTSYTTVPTATATSVPQAGLVLVTLNDGTKVYVPIKYYTDTNADGNPDFLLPTDASGNYISPVVPAGTEQKIYAVINLPPNAASTNANGTNTPLLAYQTATGTVSGIVRSDNNDTISIAPVGTIAITKTVDKPTAKPSYVNTAGVTIPGEDLTYTIVAKNGFNAAVKNFILKETDSTPTSVTATNVFANSVFKSVSVAVAAPATGTVLYRFNGGAWQTSAVPTIALNTVNSVEIGLDTAAPNNAIDANDTIVSGGQFTVTLVTTVK